MLIYRPATPGQLTMPRHEFLSNKRNKWKQDTEMNAKSRQFSSAAKHSKTYTGVAGNRIGTLADWKCNEANFQIR